MISIFGFPEGYPCPAKQSLDIQKRFKLVFDKAIAIRKTQIFERNVLSNGKVTACLICPIFADENKLSGAIVGALDVKAALYDALQPIMVESSDHAWVINEAGYLIYHPEHEELLIRNLFRADNQCFNCHADFSLEKKMISTTRGVEIKDNLLLPKQLISYARVELENSHWTIAISTPFETLTYSLRSEFKNFLILMIVIIVTIVSGAFLFNRINTKHITTKKELESLKIQAALIGEKKAAESRYQSLVEQSPDPIFLMTRKKIITINKAFEKVFGFHKNEIYSPDFPLTSLIDPSFQDYLAKEIIRFIRQRTHFASLTLKMRNKASELIEVEVSLGRLRLGNQIVYQGIVHDITKLKQLEQEREQRKHLAMIGEMSARIAHEIKNPLASIQTGIQLLETQSASNGQIKLYYERLRGEIQRVDAILKGLLNFARQEHLELKSLPITPIIKRFQKLIEPTARQHVISLKVNMQNFLPNILIDDQKIEQVLWNITLNAIQASKPKSKILLDVSSNNNGIELVIQDHGVGILPEKMDKIFQPFYSTKTQGTGLGLAISKKIIELHNGHIKIASVPGQGTKVFIFLPGSKETA